LFTIITAAFAISLASTAQAQEFLKDKTLTFIVGYSPGGTYDQYTRLIARHINKHVSGNPTRIVENIKKKKHKSWWTTRTFKLAVLAGGAAIAAGVVLATRGGGGGSAPASAPPPTVTITPGPPTVGGPQ